MPINRTHTPTVARHIITGTEYDSVWYSLTPGKIKTRNRRQTSYFELDSSHVEVLRPDLVKPVDYNYNGARKLRANNNNKKNNLREKCDLFVKSYLSTKAFIDYDSFLNDLVAFVEERQ